MTNPRHFSSFELDVYFVERDGKAPADDASSPIAEHVASCARCAAYLAGLEALDAEDDLRVPGPAPAIAPPATTAPVLRLASPRRNVRALIAPAATIAALAAAVMIYVRSRPSTDDAQYIGVKGMPAVQILVRSGGQTRVWDAQSRVRAGDSLAVHVACEQLEHVTVTSPAPSGLVRLSDSPCPKTPATLPFTLVVDDQPGPERLVVVLTRSRLDDAALRDAVRVTARSGDVWVTAFEFAKEERR